MIRALEIQIKEFRGIRDLTMELRGKNFAICGPNGTGKSGIVDALEFALTGNISRLSGSGTRGLSVKEHGPHVDRRNNPEVAFVSLKITIQATGKIVVIKRTVKNPKDPTISPNDPDVLALLGKISTHPEFVLSRRELIKYILAEPGQRAKEVQSLLRLDEIESVRTLLQKIANSCKRDLTNYERSSEDATAALRLAMQIPVLNSAALLEAANQRRTILGLPPIVAFDATTSLKDGIGTVTTTQASKIVKAQAMAQLERLQKNISFISDPEFQEQNKLIREGLNTLAGNETFLQYASKEKLLEDALAAYDNSLCPVCDTPWSPEEFAQKIQDKLAQFKAINAQKVAVGKKLSPVLNKVTDISNQISSIANLGGLLQPTIECSTLNSYVFDLNSIKPHLSEILPISKTLDAVDKISSIPDDVLTNISLIQQAVNQLPEPSQQDAARDYLVIATEKLENLRSARLKVKSAQNKANTSAFVLETYGNVTTQALENIYNNVQETFSKLYREINQDDETNFQAKLKPSLGKLGFDVDFYGRGYFPPGAYHSEGHQDGMGLCLYLALMSHLSGDSFNFAVLDDVLMSVDSGHRREVSKMIRNNFSATQFIITTHDEIWLKHMRTNGLIDNKGFVHFRNWTVDLGPTQWDSKDVWEEIDNAITQNNISSAAATLRNFLEYFSKEVCHNIRAKVEFKSDAHFSLGELLPNAISMLKNLVKKGKDAASSWGQKENLAKIEAFEKAFDATQKETQIDQWQLNAAVHYNEWANLQKQDFEPVVQAYKALVDKFKCQSCNSLFYATPAFGNPESLRCNCGDMNINLQKKTGI